MLTVLHLARDFVLPIVVALILSLVFLPVVRAMKRLFIPAPLWAGLVVLSLIVGLFGGIYYLADPARAWLEKAPQSLRTIDAKIRRITGSVHDVATATAQVQDMTNQIANGSGNQNKPQEVVMQAPTLAGAALYNAKEFMVFTTSTLVLLYFLLASGDLFLRKTVEALPRLSDKKWAVDIAQQVEATVSSYLITVTMINATLGIVVALAMYLLDVPNPVLWGVMAGVLNFIPYLGDIVSISILTIVGLLSFDELWRALSLPAVFFLLTATEGYLTTPMIVGRRSRLNPVVIVVSVLFWSWMWGILGALLAVPILVVLKTFCDRVEPLQVFGEFLGA